MYSYNDRNDVLTVSLINAVSRDSYWEDSENNILDICKAELKKEKITNFIDLGCGLGRLINVFLPFTDNLYALEPDRERCETAKKIWSEHGCAPDGKCVEIINGDIHSIAGTDGGLVFDSAISSHVLQHIPYSLADDMFRTLSGVLRPGALLFVTTTLSDKDEDVYTKESFDGDGVRLSEVTDKTEFERVFSVSGVLPVVYYTQKSVAELMEKAGFELLKSYGFHYCFDDRYAVIDDDKIKQAENDYKDARDILYIFRKKSGEV